MDPQKWEAMTPNERRQYLRDRFLVFYGGHFITEEMWTRDGPGIRREIDRKNLHRLGIKDASHA